MLTSDGKFYINKYGEICIIPASKKHCSNKPKKRGGKCRIKDLISYIKYRFNCMDCGSNKNLSFDHVLGEKQFNISDADRESYGRVVRELIKCELVCRKCHNMREKVRIYFNEFSELPPMPFFDNSLMTTIGELVKVKYGK